MVLPSDTRPRNDAVRSRDEALVRIRRATVAMGLTATVAAARHRRRRGRRRDPPRDGGLQHGRLRVDHRYNDHRPVDHGHHRCVGLVGGIDRHHADHDATATTTRPTPTTPAPRPPRASHERPRRLPRKPAVRSLQAIGTTATVVVDDPAAADAALALLADDLDALDGPAAGSGPTPNCGASKAGAAGPPVVEPAAVRRPRVGRAPWPPARRASSTRPSARRWSSWATTATSPRSATVVGVPDPPPAPAPGWWRIGLDRHERTVTVPDGVHVDLGSTGKAFGADRSAARIAAALGCGVLVNLGGDVAVAGPRAGRGLGRGHRRPLHHGAGRRRRGGRPPVRRAGHLGHHGPDLVAAGTPVHHIVDPWTGAVAPTTWALVSAVGATCVEANGWTTAAVVWGEDAPGNLAGHGVAARLVRPDGRVLTVGDWPGVAAACRRHPSRDGGAVMSGRHVHRRRPRPSGT